MYRIWFKQWNGVIQVPLPISLDDLFEILGYEINDITRIEKLS